jgi:hypothetical protein
MSPKDRPDPSAVPDPDEPPTEAELAAAGELRRLLEGSAPPEPGNADGALVEAVRAASRPAPIAEAIHRQIVDKALAKPTKSKVIYLMFGGLAGAAAMAAVLALVVRGSKEPLGPASAAAAAPMAVCRSAADLFPAGIPTTGGTSDRVDRIAYARAHDLRENRFAAWGVR